MFSYWLDDGAELRPLEPWNAAELLICVDSAREHLSAWTHLAHRVVDRPRARLSGAVLHHRPDRRPGPGMFSGRGETAAARRNH